MSLSTRIIVILFFSVQNVFFAQNKTIDSLKQALKNAKHDTTRCNILATIVENESDEAIWPAYNEQLLKLSESHLKTDNKSIVLYKFYMMHYAEALNNIGFLASVHGNVKKAVEFFSKSLEVEEKIGNKQGISESLISLGNLYQNQGDYANAIKCYEKSIKNYQEINDKQRIAESFGNIGVVYHKQNKLSIANKYLEKSLKIYEEIGDKLGIATALNNIGLTNNKIGNSQKVIEYLSKSLKLREEINDKNGIAVSLHNIAWEYFKLKNYTKSIEFGTKSMNKSLELNYPENIRNAANLLSQIYKVTGNFNLALKNYKLYIKMRDSINNIETQKATITQQAKYEYDKQKIIEDEKHKAELKIQDQKAQADSKKQNSIIASVSIVLLVVAFFSLMLYNRFKTTQQQKLIIEKKEKETQEQKEIIEEKQKEILDSINYAKRIQYTLLAHEAFLKENLNEHFTYFNPKDIVSGDFYWATKQNNKFYLAVCDSTGHGVPGAFMSLLNIGFLSEAINEKGIENPNEVFDFVRMKLTDTISKEGQKDGFDGVLICFDNTTSNITYAAANNAPVIIREGTILELESDRMPVGIGEKKENFTLYTIEAKGGDMLYLYTDGYPDQFGGPKGKKFMYKQLNQLLLAQHNNPLDKQFHELKNTFQKWKGDLEQVDDVCVIGIRI